MRAFLLPVALVMTFVMLPGAFEVVENVVHFVQHGDSAHAESPGHDRPDGDDEHGCSGGYHVCVCHHGSGFTTGNGVPTLSVVPPALAVRGRFWQDDTLPSFDFSDIFRPPIA